MRDIEELSFEKATWTPLAIEKAGILHGQYGTTGYRKSFCNIESIIVPLE
jgi:hypothetical protein